MQRPGGRYRRAASERGGRLADASALSGREPFKRVGRHVIGPHHGAPGAPLPSLFFFFQHVQFFFCVCVELVCTSILYRVCYDPPQ